MSKEFPTAMRREVLFCHGLESGPHGSKYRALCDAGYQVIAPDCQGKSLRERVDIVVPLMRELRPYVVGSSYGGITAVLAGMRAGVELPGVVLCAPALERDEEPNTGRALQEPERSTCRHRTRPEAKGQTRARLREALPFLEERNQRSTDGPSCASP